MVRGDYFTKRHWTKKLKDARRRVNKFIGNDSPTAQAHLAYAYNDEAAALNNLGRHKEAAETWTYAAKAADRSTTAKGEVAEMYRDFARQARRRSREEDRGGLEKRSLVILTILGIGAGLFFLSSNITGNAIGNMTNSTSNLVGGILFVIGLVAGLLLLRTKK